MQNDLEIRPAVSKGKKCFQSFVKIDELNKSETYAPFHEKTNSIDSAYSIDPNPGRHIPSQGDRGIE